MVLGRPERTSWNPALTAFACGMKGEENGILERDGVLVVLGV